MSTFTKGSFTPTSKQGKLKLKLLIAQHFSVLGRGVIVLTAEDHHKALFTQLDWIFNFLMFKSVNPKQSKVLWTPPPQGGIIGLKSDNMTCVCSRRNCHCSHAVFSGTGDLEDLDYGDMGHLQGQVEVMGMNKNLIWLLPLYLRIVESAATL